MIALSGLPLDILMKYGGVLLTTVGSAYVAFATLFGDTIFSRYYHRYVEYLDRDHRLLFLPANGQKTFIYQVLAAAVAIALGTTIDLRFYLAVPLVGVAPWADLRKKRADYLKQLETQVDGFILGLANSMKTVPSASAALAALVPVLPNPTRQEIDRVLREIRVGSTLEQALLNMAARLRSPTMDSALSALLIGLQVGGNLPTVLENTASTIREMNRLDGVVKTKTAEGKAQLWVLAIFPFAICGMFNCASEGYFEPLQKSVVGYIVTTVAVLIWMSSLILARKILKVDI